MKTHCLFLLLFLAHSVSSLAASVEFSTYIGGDASQTPTAITTGADGSIYVTGLSQGGSFPNANPLGNGNQGFVTKLTPDGKTILYAVELGGIFPRAIAVDALGQAYVVGYSYYGGFPTTNAWQTDRASDYDAAILKLNAAGDAPLFATFFGGADDDAALGIGLTSHGDIWVTGVTLSENLPTTPNALQPSRAGEKDAFIAEFSNDGQTLKYSSYFGGAEGITVARGLAIDAADRPVVVGRTSAASFPVKNAWQAVKKSSSDAFVATFVADGAGLVFSTFLGGSGTDSGISVALDAAQNIFVHGLTQSSDLPVQNAYQATYPGEVSAFIAKFSPAAESLVYLSYFGGSQGNAYRGYPNVFGATSLLLDVGQMAVSPTGRAMVVGTTYSSDVPLVAPVKSTNIVYSTDGMAAIFEPDGSVHFATYLGGNSNETLDTVAATPDGQFLLGGASYPGPRQPDYPTTAGALQTVTTSDVLAGFVTRISAGLPQLANDAFASATILQGRRATALVQTDAATREAGEPVLAPNASGKTAWFRWTAPASGRLIVNALATFDVAFGVFRGSSLASLIPANAAVFNSFAPNSVEGRGYVVTAGETLNICVDGLNGSAGSVMLSVQLSLPDNDDFAARRILHGTTVSDAGTNVGATSEADDGLTHSVWWEWSTPVAGPYTVSTVGSDFDTGVVVYRQVSRPNEQSLTGSDSYTNNLGRVIFNAEANVAYQIAVFGDYGSTGNILLNIAPSQRPPNDDFTNRTFLTQRNETVAGSNFDSVYDLSEWALEGVAELPSRSGNIVWWQWTPPVDGAAQISTAGSHPINSPTDPAVTWLIVFEGDEIPNAKDALTVGADANLRTSASLYLPTVRAGTHYQIGVDSLNWPGPSAIQLNIREIAPPRIISGSAHFTAGGKFAASVEGTEGHNYRVTASTDLKTWTGVGEFPLITGAFDFEAPTAGAYRFYRIEEY